LASNSAGDSGCKPRSPTVPSGIVAQVIL